MLCVIKKLLYGESAAFWANAISNVIVVSYLILKFIRSTFGLLPWLSSAFREGWGKYCGYRVSGNGCSSQGI